MGIMLATTSRLRKDTSKILLIMEANPALKLLQSCTLAEYSVDCCHIETLEAVSQFLALLQGSGPSSHLSVVSPYKSC